jgi:hypothetical protein
VAQTVHTTGGMSVRCRSGSGDSAVDVVAGRRGLCGRRTSACAPSGLTAGTGAQLSVNCTAARVPTLSNDRSSTEAQQIAQDLAGAATALVVPEDPDDDGNADVDSEGAGSDRAKDLEHFGSPV